MLLNKTIKYESLQIVMNRRRCFSWSFAGVQSCGVGNTQTIFLYSREASSVQRLRQSDYKWSDLPLQVLRQINDEAL
jgi:hypothetical protein